MWPTDVWLFNNLSLKYLATVKTVKVLYIRSGALDGLKEFLDNVLQERDTSKYSPRTLVHPMLTRFDSFLDTLMLPTTIKNDLSLCFWQLLEQVFDSAIVRSWISQSPADLNIGEDVSNIIVNHLRWISWDAIGRIDPNSHIEDYSRMTQTITYRQWALLCGFCSEYYIRKYAHTVDWNECTYQTPLTIFWYYTIYGTFPTEKMFSSPSSHISFQTFQSHRDLGHYGENNIVCHLFLYSVYYESFEAVKFFCNRLTEAQKLSIIPSEMERILMFAPKDKAVYLLAQIKFNYSSVGPMNFVPLKYLLSWPYVLFIDSWIDKFDIGDIDQFVAIFIVLMDQWRGEQAAGFDEFTKRQIWNYLYVKYYVPFQKLWTLCCNKFSFEDEVVFKIVCVIFNSEDITLCKIVMKESTSTWRQACLHYIEYCESSLEFMLNAKFCNEFMEEILINDEERYLFCSIRHEVLEYLQVQRDAEYAEVMQIDV